MEKVCVPTNSASSFVFNTSSLPLVCLIHTKYTPSIPPWGFFYSVVWYKFLISFLVTTNSLSYFCFRLLIHKSRLWGVSHSLRVKFLSIKIWYVTSSNLWMAWKDFQWKYFYLINIFFWCWAITIVPIIINSNLFHWFIFVQI